MDHKRLPDSLKPRWSRDDLMETRLGLRAWYQDPTTGGEPAKTDPPPETPPATPPAEPPKEPGITGDDVDKDKLKEILADRNRKGKLAQEEKSRADAAEAELAKYKKAEEERLRKERSELENLQADLAKKDEETAAEKKARIEAEEKLAARDREIACTQAGIDPDLADVVQEKLKAAQSKDPDLDEKKWFEDQKEKHPKWFGEAPPPVSTSSGPPRQGAKNNDAAITELLKKRESLQKAGSLTREEAAKIDTQIEVLRLG